MSDDLVQQLEADYGALPSQVVDLERDDEPGVLRYLDLCTGGHDERRPIVIEQAGEPRLHVFDGRSPQSDDQLKRWCYRIALRGDGAWVAVAEPGRLRVYRPQFKGETISPQEELLRADPRSLLPRLLYGEHATGENLAARKYLLDLLQESIDAAIAHGLCAEDALSFVGRGLFWRFLVDRNLLQGCDLNVICAGAKSHANCLDNKSHALQTFQWLDATFNGGLLPLPDARHISSAAFTDVLGNIAHGATASGQLRLPTDWQEVNFAHIPVGLLSEVYEAYAHRHNAAQAKSESIHYTPRHIAEFMLAEALPEVKPGEQVCILDPAVGAGVFLTTAFRRLAEAEWRASNRRPNRQKLRRILNTQLTGFDINPSALRLAELALYLTALELDPRPQPLKELRFDKLRERVLFHLPGGVDGGSLAPVAAEHRGKYDLVIGNPPWTAKAKGGTAKKAWVEATRDVVGARLGAESVAEFDFPDTNPDLPFVWRAMEWAKPGGQIAFVTHARWLFGLSPRATKARNDIFEAVHVTGILNGAALRQTCVWPEVTAPFCMLFASNSKPPTRAAFQFVSPAPDVCTVKEQTQMRIDWIDASVVSTADVLEKPWTLKARFRGNRLAERALETMTRARPVLEQYLAANGTAVCAGFVVGRPPRQVAAAALNGLPEFTAASTMAPVIDTKSLAPFVRSRVERPRSRLCYRAPLLILRECVPGARLELRAARSVNDVAYCHSFHGISFAGVDDGESVARYLQLLLQARPFVFFELLCDGRYGVERDVVYLESIKQMPVVPYADLDRQQKARAAALSKRLSAPLSLELAQEIDDFVFDLYGFSAIERQAIVDTLETSQPTPEVRRRALAMPNRGEIEAFVSTLSDSLTNVLSASEQCARVRVRDDLAVAPWRWLQVDMVPAAQKQTALAKLPKEDVLELADEHGSSLISVKIDSKCFLVGQLNRYALWTPTRARLLATDLLVERAGRG